MENEIEFSKVSDEGDYKTGIHDLDTFHSELEEEIESDEELELDESDDEMLDDEKINISEYGLESDESELEESEEEEATPEDELKELYKHKSNLPYDKIVEKILALKGK